MATKNCSRCGKTKPLTEFHKRKASKDGLCPICKPCAIVKSQKWYSENIERKKAFDREYNKTPERKARQFAYRETVRARESARTKAWYEANKERARKYHSERFLRDKNKLYQKAREWKKNNPGKVNSWTAARRAARHLATPPWANLDEIKMKYVEAKKMGLHVDHVIPLKSKLVCGLHVEGNLQLLHPLDNFKKSNKKWPDMP